MARKRKPVKPLRPSSDPVVAAFDVVNKLTGYVPPKAALKKKRRPSKP